MSQHMDALALANEMRLARCAVKRELRGGALTIAAALEDERAAGVAIFDMLRVQRRWGRTRALIALRDAGIHDEQRKIGDLTDRQRDLVAYAVNLRNGLEQGAAA